MTYVFIRVRRGEHKHSGEDHMKIETEIGLRHIPAKQCQELPLELKERHGIDSPLEPPEGNYCANT